MITVYRMHVLPEGFLGLGASSMLRMKSERALALGHMTSSQVINCTPPTDKILALTLLCYKSQAWRVCTTLSLAQDKPAKSICSQRSDLERPAVKAGCSRCSQRSKPERTELREHAKTS